MSVFEKRRKLKKKKKIERKIDILNTIGFNLLLFEILEFNLLLLN